MIYGWEALDNTFPMVYYTPNLKSKINLQNNDDLQEVKVNFQIWPAQLLETWTSSLKHAGKVFQLFFGQWVTLPCEKSTNALSFSVFGQLCQQMKAWPNLCKPSYGYIDFLGTPIPVQFQALIELFICIHLYLIHIYLESIRGFTPLKRTKHELFQKNIQRSSVWCKESLHLL